MKRSEVKSLYRKAYCGDGILRHCLGILFLIKHPGTPKNMEFTNKLESNKVLAKIVRYRDDLFGQQSGTVHFLATIYEARLFDVFEIKGLEGCINFIIETFEIYTKTAEDIYNRWDSLNITFGGPKQIYTI